MQFSCQITGFAVQSEADLSAMIFGKNQANVFFLKKVPVRRNFFL